MTVADFTSQLRELLSELESAADAPNPNDISNAVEELSGLSSEINRIAGEVYDLRYAAVEDVPDTARSLQDDLESLVSTIDDLESTLQSWI